MYYNNSNRNLSNAYEETLKEQQILEQQLMLEEMGDDTINAYQTIYDGLVVIRDDMTAYYNELKQDYNRDSGEEMVKVSRNTLGFVKDFFNNLFSK